MLHQLPVGGPGQGPEPQQAGVVSQLPGQSRFGHRLGGVAHDSRNQNRAGAPRVAELPFPDGLAGELQHRPEQAVAGKPDGKLGGVDSDRETAGAGIEVIPGQSPLAPFVQGPARSQSQGMGRNDQTPAQPGPPAFLPHHPSSRQKAPLRSSKWVGLPSLSRHAWTVGTLNDFPVFLYVPAK